MMKLVFSALVFLGLLGAADAPLPDRAAARFLDQATWGPTPASITQLQQQGFAAWLQAQFALKTSDLPDQPLFNGAGKNNNDLRPVQAAFFQNAVTGQDQLRQRVAFALSQIWVVSAESGVPEAYAYPPYWRIFRDNAFANYRDVIKAATLSPAMGRYLNMANNNKGNTAKGTAANENYARELMQLFTLGLTQLHPDGTPVLDQNNHPMVTYDQAVVTNLAKAFTGWTYPTAPGAIAKNNNPAYYIGQMLAVEANHDTTQKTIFGGDVIAAAQTAEQDLDTVIADLMKQPTMAPFVSQQLIQHLVTSNPSPGYIGRVSSVFTNDGNGVRGNLQAVIMAILTDPDARAADDPNSAPAANFGHLREPVLLMANLLRGLNASLSAASTIYYDTMNMGQNLFYSPSVFSYFSPQYRTEKGLLGPEFQIYSTSTVSQRADIVNSILYGTLDKGTKVNLEPFLQQDGNFQLMLDYISYVFLHHSMSSDLQGAAVEAARAATTSQAQVQAALYIVLTSGEYQVIQ